MGGVRFASQVLQLACRGGEKNRVNLKQRSQLGLQRRGCVTVRARPPSHVGTRVRGPCVTQEALSCHPRALPLSWCRALPVHSLRSWKNKSGSGPGRERSAAASPQRKFLTLAVSSSSSALSVSSLPVCPLWCRVIISHPNMLPFVVSLLFATVKYEAAGRYSSEMWSEISRNELFILSKRKGTIYIKKDLF